jgi:E3 ubiquitin-protein ligase MARCH7
MIKPCKCTGTVEFVHEGCLREWIRTKVERSEAKEIITCELCQAEYNYGQEEMKQFECSQAWVSWKKNRGEMQCYIAL